MVLGVVVVLGLWGCASGPSEAVEEERATLSSIAPPESPAAVLDEGEEAVAPSATQYRLARVDVSLDRPLNAAWALVDDTTLGPIKSAVWQNNGLRLGKVSARRVDELQEAVGVPLATRRSTMVNLTEPAPIRSGATVRRPVPIDLTVPPMNIRREWASSGRFRLLMREIAAGSAGVSLELTPHLYRPAASLVPRQPGQDELDGLVFEELVASVNLTPDEVLVIGLHWDWVEEGSDRVPNFLAEEAEDETQASEVGGEGLADGVAGGDASPGTGEAPGGEGAAGLLEEPAVVLQAPPLPVSVGRELFAARRAGEPVQVLLLVTVVDASVRVGPPPAGE